MKMYAGNLIRNMTKKNPVISLTPSEKFFHPLSSAIYLVVKKYRLW